MNISLDSFQKVRLFCIGATAAIVSRLNTWKQAVKPMFFTAIAGTNNGRKMGITFRPLKSLLLIIIAVLALSRTGQAFTGLTVSTAAPAGTTDEAVLISILHQWDMRINLLSSTATARTYQVEILGPAPVYTPPPPIDSQLLQEIDNMANYITTIDSDTYVYGWAAGVSYQQDNQIDTMGNYAVNCSSPTYFPGASTTTWDSGTCQALMGNIIHNLYLESLSTAPVAGF